MFFQLTFARNNFHAILKIISKLISEIDLLWVRKKYSNYIFYSFRSNDISKSTFRILVTHFSSVIAQLVRIIIIRKNQSTVKNLEVKKF